MCSQLPLIRLQLCSAAAHAALPVYMCSVPHGAPQDVGSPGEVGLDGHV